MESLAPDSRRPHGLLRRRPDPFRYLLYKDVNFAKGYRGELPLEIPFAPRYSPYIVYFGEL